MGFVVMFVVILFCVCVCVFTLHQSHVYDTWVPTYIFQTNKQTNLFAYSSAFLISSAPPPIYLIPPKNSSFE